MSVLDINSDLTFNRAINSKPIVVIDFYADWCGPCKAIKPAYEQMAKRYGAGNSAKVQFARVDVDQLQSVSQQCGVSAMPTFVLFKNGKQAATVVGADIASVERELKKLLQSTSGSGSVSGAGYVLGTGKKVVGSAGGNRVGSQANGGLTSMFGRMSELQQQMLVMGLMLAALVYYYFTKSH